MKALDLVRGRRLHVAALIACAGLMQACVVRGTLNGETVVNGGIGVNADQQAGGAQAEGDDVGSVEDFDEPLAAHGDWVEVEGQGRVWQPKADVVGDDFEPYATGGEWVKDDDDNYVFQSKWDADWGWATFHYGRWGFHDDYGWYWVPGTEYAPAWVEWRYGGGYVGWVPMAPAGVVYTEDRWTFVEERYIASPGIITYRLPAERVRVVYRTAVPLTTTVVVRGRTYRSGPRVAGVTVRVVPKRSATHVAARTKVKVKVGGSARAKVNVRGGGGRGSVNVKAKASTPRKRSGGGGRRR